MARQYAWWSDTDDSVVTMFSPQEAAQILGRSIQSVYHRRSLKDLGGANRDRKPRRRLRRAYFSTGQGERDEAVAKRQGLSAESVAVSPHAHQLCNRCYSRIRYLLKCGYISREEVARLWRWAIHSVPPSS